MFHKFATALTCLIALGGVAMAKGPEQGVPQQSLTWEQFKESCVNPAQFNRQRPPANIEVTCEHTATAWVQTDGGAFNLPQARRIAGSVISDKFSVSRQEFSVAVPPDTGYCPRFKEVIRTYSTQRAISLEEALAFKDADLGQVCLAILDDELTMNQKLILEADTGRVLDTCPSTAPQGK